MLSRKEHDRQTKRQRRYAEFGVANYWLLDAYRRTLECLVLERGAQPPAYRPDAAGEGDEEVRPTAFAGLVVELRTLWM